jgi:hypothetical protein
MNWIECAKPLRKPTASEIRAECETMYALHCESAKEYPDVYRGMKCERLNKAYVVEEDNQAALDASIAARNAGEWEEVPVEKWKTGDVVECTLASNDVYTVRALYTVLSEFDGELVRLTDNHIHTDPSGCRVNPYGQTEQFRLRRRKSDFIKPNLTIPVLNSKWLTRGGWCAKNIGGDNYLHDGSEKYMHHFNGEVYSSQQQDRDYDIIAPWID